MEKMELSRKLSAEGKPHAALDAINVGIKLMAAANREA